MAVGNSDAQHGGALGARQVHESGLIGRTQRRDLAGVGETGVPYSARRACVVAIVSWSFHKAEVMNREVTALATFRMTRAAGEGMQRALDSAQDLAWKTSRLFQLVAAAHGLAAP
jgi:hypothetical protein